MINNKLPKRAKDYRGRTFGRLTVLTYSGKQDKNKNTIWICKCSCGNIKEASSKNLLSNTKSCGCLQEESLKTNHLSLKNRQTRPPGEANFTQTFIAYRNSAAKKEREFLLTKEQFRDITSKNCFYCGTEPKAYYKNPNSNGYYIHNGIDRIDSSKGYILDNIVPCCKVCNIAKNSMSKDEFLSWVDKIYNYQHGRED